MRLKKKNKAPILQLEANTKIIQGLNIKIENESNGIYHLSIIYTFQHNYTYILHNCINIYIYNYVRIVYEKSFVKIKFYF